MASKKMGVLAEPPVAKKAMSEEPDYEGEQHANDLMRAGEILNNPDKMKKAMKHIGKKKLAIKSVADIKAYHQAKYGKGQTAPQSGGIDETKESSEDAGE